MWSGLLCHLAAHLSICWAGLKSGWRFSSKTSLVADLVSAFRNSKCGGGIWVCALRISPAIVHMAPSIVIATLHCADCILLVKAIDPVLFRLEAFGLCGRVYHTSAA